MPPGNMVWTQGVRANKGLAECTVYPASCALVWSRAQSSPYAIPTMQREPHLARGKIDPRPSSISHNYVDSGRDGLTESLSKYSAGIWTGDWDAEFSGLERKDSASEAGNDHDDEIAF